jgi:hypothetical protein
MTLSHTTLVAGALQMRVVGDGSRIEWRDIRRDERLIEAEEGAWMAPILDGRPLAAGARRG